MKIKKIGALVLALVMVLAMSSTAFAAAGDPVPASGIQADGGNTLTFTKSILMKNTNASSVREPNITYTYTITDAGISGKTVTDNNGYVGQVYSIVGEGGTLAGVLADNDATAVFADTNPVSTSTAGVETSENVSFSFTGANFPHAGIYRFIVRETFEVNGGTGTQSKAAVGIIENNANYSDTMYLDVYVSGAGGTNSIYAYVLFKTSQNVNIEDTDESTNNTHQKSAGWCGGNDGNATTATYNQDIYETYDIELTKTTEGDNTAKNNEFPFSLVIGGSTTTNQIDIAVANGTLTGANTRALTAGNNTIAVALKNGGSMTIIGVPAIATTTIDVTETNNTYDVYTVTTTVDGTADASGVIQNTQTKAIGQVSVAADNLAKKTVAYTNTLTQISPTGVVLRIAPYALMLGVGILLFLLSRKRRNAADEA